MFSADKITEIFCLIDEFSKEFEYFIQKSLIGVKSRNKVFKDIANVGKSTMGCFYGFKLHLIIN